MKKGMLMLLTVLFWAAGLNAQTPYQLLSSEMTIAGTSTIHDWESTVNEVQVEGQFVLNDQMLGSIESLFVAVPVKSIISGRGNTMDKKTWKALKSEEYPNVTYTLKEVTEVEALEDGQRLLLNGLVNIAGEERAMELEVTGRMLEDGNMEFSASKLLDMTDFEIDPPTALFGTLKTGKEITVHFAVVMTPESAVK